MQVAREYKNTTKSVMTPPHTPAKRCITFWMVAACLISLAKASTTRDKREMMAKTCIEQGDEREGRAEEGGGKVDKGTAEEILTTSVATLGMQ